MKENLVYELNEVLRELSSYGQSVNSVKHTLDNKMADAIKEVFGDYSKAEELREKVIQLAKLQGEVYYMFDKLSHDVSRHG